MYSKLDNYLLCNDKHNVFYEASIASVIVKSNI